MNQLVFPSSGTNLPGPWLLAWRITLRSRIVALARKMQPNRSVLNFNYKNGPPPGLKQLQPITRWLHAADLRIVPSARQTALILALAFAATGCQHLLEDTKLDNPRCNIGCDVASSRPGREVAMNRIWQNRRLSELRAKLGPPLMIMGIPGGGNPPGFVAVYATDPVTGCIDAFAFTHSSDPVIRVYHCR
jgi:hypothetical protein